MILASTVVTSFWEFNVGNVVTIVALVPVFWQAHRASVRSIENREARVVKLETDVALLMASRCPFGECPLRAHVNLALEIGEKGG